MQPFQFTIRRMMIAVAIVAIVLGIWFVTQRMILRIESEAMRYHAAKTKNPAEKARLTELADHYDRLLGRSPAPKSK